MGAELSPNWSSASASTPADLAYVTYAFNVSAYDRNAQVRLDWHTPPADFHTSWIALANWPRDRWDWYQGTADGNINLPGMASYFNASNDLLCVVLRTGADMSILAHIRLGTPGPVPSFTITPVLGSAPLNVTLDASATTTSEGTITKYEWDLDGNSTFETDGGATSTYSTSYSDNAQHWIGLRATNSLGVSADFSSSCDSVAPWQHTWGQSSNEEFSNAAVDGSGNIYVTGYTRATSGPFNDDLLLAKYSPHGLELWKMRWDGGISDYGLQVRVDDAGDVIVAGATDASGDRQTLMQKWNPTGILLWSKTFGGVDFDSPSGLVLSDAAIYTGGSTKGWGADSDLFVCQLDGTGGLIWAQARDHGDDDYGTDLTALKFLFGITGLSVVGEAYASGTPNIWRVDYGTDGTFDAGYEFGNSTEEKRDGHMWEYYDFFSSSPRFFLTGVRDGGSGNELFLSLTDGASVSIYGTRWWNTSAPSVSGLAFDSAGDLVVTGQMPGFEAGSDYGMLWKFDAGVGDFLASEYLNNGDIQTHFSSITQYFGGLLLTGSCHDASGTWSALAGASGTFSDTWTQVDGSGGALGWVTSDEPGTVSDLLLIGDFDTGAGGDDALVLYHGSPGA